LFFYNFNYNKITLKIKFNLNKMKYTSTEIRQKFLDFFKSKNHAIIPSAPLVPENDPSALFNVA